MRSNRPILYDITRLVLRLARPVPNGIDRVDLMLAMTCLGASAETGQGLLMTPFGPRLIAPAPTREILAHLARLWDGEHSEEAAALFGQLVERLSGTRADCRFRARAASRHTAAAAAILSRAGDLFGRPIGQAPAGAVYVNASQFPIWIDGCYGWLQGQGIPGLFFIHDLLPLQAPHFFPRGEARRHARRLETVARRASGVLVSSHDVADALNGHCRTLGCGDLPIEVAPLPVAPAFAQPAEVPEKLREAAYFVLCGTVEPRKNHRLVLRAWREMAQRLGAATPTLVLVGVRGWDNDEVYALLDCTPELRRHVVEVNGLANAHLRTLLAGARALLFPSFAEGYGLPFYEALAAGVPVLASDIPAFRHVEAEGLKLLDPTDEGAWLAAIAALGAAPRQAPSPPPLPTVADFERTVSGFLATLAPIRPRQPRPV